MNMTCTPRRAVRDYESTHDIGALLVSLGRVLTKKKHHAMLNDIRAVVPSSDLPTFDEEVAIWTETGIPRGVNDVQHQDPACRRRVADIGVSQVLDQGVDRR